MLSDLGQAPWQPQAPREELDLEKLLQTEAVGRLACNGRLVGRTTAVPTNTRARSTSSDSADPRSGV